MLLPYCKKYYFCDEIMKILSHRFRLYRKIRYRKGYGVHSPFVYNLITRVVEEKSPYYAFDEIEKERQELLVGNHPFSMVTAKETQHRNYGALLFRLVNFFKCRSVLQIGSSTGIMSLYLGMASRNNCRCIVLEERQALAECARMLAEKKRLDNLSFLQGKYEELLRNLTSSVHEMDLIFVNTRGDAFLSERVIRESLSLIHENTILVIDGIGNNKPMRDLWKRLKNQPQTRVSIDLYAMGMFFFNEKLHKQHYQTYFDYGKKQNLYKNRRQRFNFLSRRKKSFQIPSKN